MAEKAVTPEKKAEVKEAPAAEKKAAAKKTTAVAKKTATRAATRRTVSKGDVFACDVCGLSVVVDECGEIAVTPTFVCCGEIMRPKTRRTRAAKK